MFSVKSAQMKKAKELPSWEAALNFACKLWKDGHSGIQYDPDLSKKSQEK